MLEAGGRFVLLNLLRGRGIVVRSLEVRGGIKVLRYGRRQLACGRVEHGAGFNKLCNMLTAEGFIFNELISHKQELVLVLRENINGALIVLCHNALNLLVNHPGYYLSCAREAFDIIKEAENPFAKVVYDIYHQQVTEGNIIPTVRENLEHIAHLHAAAHPGRIDLWLGENDYKFIFGAIDAAGYEGHCGLEYRPTVRAEESLLKIRELYG